jgi:hypothetical protein
VVNGFGECYFFTYILKFYLDINDFEYSVFAIIAKLRDRSTSQSTCFRGKTISTV